MRFRDKLKSWLGISTDEATGDAPQQYASQEESDIDPFNPFPDLVEIEITDVFDLHTIAPRDVKQAVEAYLEEARQRGFPSVRIIHGKGIGVQREIVRTILARTSFIENFTDAPPEAGGWGATIARLSRQK
jgi:Smr domain